LGAGGGGRDEGERGDEANPAREKAHELLILVLCLQGG
jgi:hypothetical protein